MSAVATAIAGAAVVGAVVSSNASSNAASAEENAANSSNATQMSMFNTEQGNLQPYMAAGTSALGQLNANMGSYNSPFTMNDFYGNENPGYAFDLGQGEQAIQSQAGASGHLESSQELGNASNYAENMANNQYQNAFSNYETQINNSYSRLAGVANIGEAAAAGTNSAGQNAANNISANTVGAGNAAAAGTVGSANALSSGVTGLANAYTMSSLMNNAGTTSTGSQPVNFSNGAGNGVNSAFASPSMPTLSQPSLGSGSTVSSLY